MKRKEDATARLLQAVHRRCLVGTAGMLLAIVLAGCAVGPDYQHPATEAQLATGWHAPLPHDGEMAQLQEWWRQFDDPVLDQLIDTGEKTSPTIAQAVARIDQARATAAVANAGFFPQLGASARLTRSASSIVGSTAAFGGAITPVGNSHFYQSLSTGQLDASWEIDLFGRLRRTREAAVARVDAAQSGWDDARIALAAEIATSYLDLRGCENMAAIYADQLASQEKTRDLTQLKVSAGFLPEADGQRIIAAAAQTAAQLDNQKGLCAQGVNYLANLTGLSQDDLHKDLQNGTGVIPWPRATAIAELPIQTILQRPDVTVSERTLAAASADIGVAEAARYPALSLTGVVSINSQNALSDRYRNWSFGPAVDVPIFDAGSRRAAVRRARGVYDEALGAWRQSVRQAANEVEDALVRLDTAAKREANAREAVAGYESALHSGEESYRAGRASLLDVETARRSLLDARLTLASVQQEWSQAWVALYKAAGGGWALNGENT